MLLLKCIYIKQKYFIYHKISIEKDKAFIRESVVDIQCRSETLNHEEFQH